MVFRVRDLAGLEAVARLPALEDAALDTAQAVLEQCAKFQQGGGREEVVDRQQTARVTEPNPSQAAGPAYQNACDRWSRDCDAYLD